MELVCLDLEGVLIPEIWIAAARETGLDELKLTTRDIRDYSELMNRRIDILNREGIGLRDIQNVIASLDPLEGAREFSAELRSRCPMVLLSDTFDQFAAPLMRKLDYPTLFCNTLTVDDEGRITGCRLRQGDGKRRAVEGFQSMGFRVFAAGDSYNDVSMLQAADASMLFRAPRTIRDEFPRIPAGDDYRELRAQITDFLGVRPESGFDW